MLRNIPKALVLFLSAFLFNSSALSQPSNKDKTEAIRVAHKFTQRLRRSQDLKPLLGEFFAPDFVDQARRDKGFNFFTLLMPDLPLKPDLARRYYLATENWFYLTWLYNCTKNPSAFGSDDLKIASPVGVTRIMEKSPLLRYVLHPDEGSDVDMDFIQSSDGVLKLTIEAEKMSSIYREYLTSVRKMSDQQFLRAVSKCELPDKPFFHIEIVKCDGFADCHGLPKTAHLIGVSVPVFDYIDMVPIKGRMKIIRLFNWDENLS